MNDLVFKGENNQALTCLSLRFALLLRIRRLLSRLGYNVVRS